jgi:hypothetical protein
MPEGNADPLTILATINANLTTLLTTPDAVLEGTVTLAAAAAPLIVASTLCKSVTIENVSTNDVVNVGNAATQRYALQPGATVSMDIDNLNKVYVSGTAGNIVTYIAVN